MTAEQAVSALNHGTFWPGLLQLEPGLEAKHEDGCWHLSQGNSRAVSDQGRMISGSWAVRPGQAVLQLLLGTSLASYGLYSLANAAKLPVTAALVNFSAPLVVLALLYLALWGVYLLDYLGQNLMDALQTVHSGYQALPDAGNWRETLHPIAVAQSMYVLESLFAAHQQGSVNAPLLFGMATQVILVLACCRLSPTPMRSIGQVAGWSALWSLPLLNPKLYLFVAVPAVVLVTVPLMLKELRNGLSLNVNTETLTEKLFWLGFLLMVCVSFGALLGHALCYATMSYVEADKHAKQWWVWGATLGTILALFVAPLGKVRIPLFIVSTLYQALLGKFGAVAALAGAILLILVRALWLHPRQPLVAFQYALTFGLAEATGRVAGACLGLFFLGLEGGAVGSALGERALGAWALLRQEEGAE